MSSDKQQKALLTKRAIGMIEKMLKTTDWLVKVRYSYEPRINTCKIQYAKLLHFSDIPSPISIIVMKI